MRPRVALSLAAAVAVVAVFAAGFFVGQQYVVVRPSPSPEPTVVPTLTATPTVAPTSAAPSPSPSITASPTRIPATQQPTPEPTPSTVAGDRLIPFYFEIRPMFSAMPPTPVIEFDSNTGADENARFDGLDAQGQPKFSVRHDFVMDKGTAAHEMGHAYQKVLERRDPTKDYLAMYWAFRGFPGTWQQALAQSEAQPSFSAKWINSPIESWAEAFRAAVMLEAKEKTLDYGKTIDPIAARQFFQSLAK